MSPPASLSVVMPVHNELDSVEQTLRELRQAAAVSPWADCQVVVVDDGSNDGTAALLDSLAAELTLTVVHQANAGRLDAREVGLRTATTELVLLLDARVHLDPAALTHLAEQLLLDPAAVLWNGHVNVATRGNPYAA
ncbi:MAG: glycosyltransferase family 2 protein, partial [Frankiales bacterium]|nr:glycosyltransferase family 2 protein [Frankiales bacterium]